jgi:hypothetical protein
VKIYNAQGRLIDTAFDGPMAEGAQMIQWAPRQKASGVYYYNVVAGGNTAKGKLLVVN